MNILVSLLFLPSVFYHSVNLPGCDAVRFTNGFPSRLTYHVFTLSSSQSTRLIPEMNFTCNGSIVGYKVAGLIGGNHEIQVWREMSPDSQHYYKVDGKEIDDSLCTGGLNSDGEVFQCNLTTRISVQSGDILGLKLPRNSGLLFATATKAPTNYVFTGSVSALAESDSVELLPQITLEIESGGSQSKDCTRGFPDNPISELSNYTRSSTVTLLIPSMNFTCNATIAGFAVAGTRLNSAPHSQFQVWRKNTSESHKSVYYKTGNTFVMNTTGSVCAAAWRIVNIAYGCTLFEASRLSVQPGDILGLQLPNNNFEILFTSGGPVNFIHAYQLNSTVVLSHNDSVTNSIARQLPQITFNFTSEHCLSGFPEQVVFEGNRGRGELGRVTTRLFPELKFGCFGTIVGVTAAILDATRGRNLIPKVQIWRENDTQPGLYHRMSSTNNLIRWGTNRCYRRTLNRGIYQCYSLRENYRISVQPGDFLGLEIPPINNDDPVIYFKAGGPTNLVFQYPLNATVDRSTEPHNITHDEPQITFLVLLDDNADSCPSASDVLPSQTTESDATIHATTVPKNENNSDSKATLPDNPNYSVPKNENNSDSKAMLPDNPNSSPASIVYGSAIGGIIAILLLAVIILLMVVLVYQRKQKQRAVTSSSGTYQNPVYDAREGALYRRSKELETGTNLKDDTSANYDHVKFNVKKEAVSFHTDVQNVNFSVTYETLETQHYEMTGPTLATHEEPYIYWEPANTVNDLHKQLSSNKYRELLRQQVKITKALGSGQFGVVSMGVWQSPMGAMEVAVKQLQPGVTEAEKIRFLQEAAINGQFRHPNVVQLMGVVTVGEPAMIVLELLSNGDLRNFLIKSQTSQKLEPASGMDKQLLLRFCQHIASGMSYLASKAFVHRDLAARNILVSKDNICKISDFGMSRDLLDEDYYVSRGGMVPVKWTAPEAIHYKKYSTASDVWSFGCVMYEIWSLGHKPFESYNNAEVIKMIDKGYRLPPPPGLTKELYKIMIQCWHSERFRRPTFPQLVELLSRADFELFLWEEEDLRNSSDPRVREIGAPLETAAGLYPELQRTYLANK